jgi:hypothetical protein
MNYRILNRILIGLLAVLILCGMANRWLPAIAEEIVCDSDGKNCVPRDLRNPNTEIEIFSPEVNTTLLTQTPRISWSAVEGATSYTIWVQDTEESKPKQEVTIKASDLEFNPEGKTSIEYVFDRPLSPEMEYQLTLETSIEDIIITNSVIFSVSSQAEIDAAKTIPENP